MKIVFVSNYYNHHQAPFSDAIYEKNNHQYAFIETQPMDEERKNMGWGQKEKPDYVYQSYISPSDYHECQKMIDEAEVVVWGSCPFKMIRPRLRKGKLTFAYSERLFKKGFQGIDFWGRAIKYITKLGTFQGDNHYLLCAGGYVADDYSKIGLFRNRSLKFGYFPEIKRYSMDQLFEKKNRTETTEILWTGRMIDWKHPETVLQLANSLRMSGGGKFHVTMIGNGAMKDKLCEFIESYELKDVVTLLDFMSPEKIREYMEQADIYLFTSDFGEGWGAVLNEAMNSGCVVIASHAIGAVPFLIKHKENGYIYHYGNTDELIQMTEDVLLNKTLRRRVGEHAYQTITNEWNADLAATNFLKLCILLNKGACNSDTLIPQGPCSKTEQI